ncbi:CHASE3 domain-containing protein [Leptolyngbya sp. 15MV]|nr:CHASE3 domain-containing protein [Leptolyngbya sp. 15MV]
MSDGELSRRAPANATRRPVAILLAVALAMLMVALSAGFVAFSDATSEARRVEHTLEVQSLVSRISAMNERIETARRGFIIRPEAEFRQVIEQAQTQFDRDVARLRRLVADNPRQSGHVASLHRLDAERDAMIASLLDDPSIGRRQTIIQNFNDDPGVVLKRRQREVIDALMAEEERLLRLRGENQVEALVRLYWVGGLSLLLLLATLGGIIALVLRYNRALNRAQGLLEVVNTGLEESVAERTAELTRANQEIQRFAYIVSHDLRSPLVNVLGFTAELDEARKVILAYIERLFEAQPDLRDEEVRIAVEEDLPEALGFIRTSTEKMDRLINSILELSRQGRRQLAPETLDMNALAAGVVATMHQRAEDAGATVTLEPIPQLESDRLAVEQILANLVENALKYLSPSRAGAVTISGRRQGRMVRIDVTDNGRGIASADHQRIFDLFRRSGTQDQPGEGIGLANVRALAYRLGGTIEVESELDQGASFRLFLPAKLVATE